MIHNDTNLQDGHGYCRECDSYEREIRKLTAKLEAAEKKIATLEAVLQYYKDECYRAEIYPGEIAGIEGGDDD